MEHNDETASKAEFARLRGVTSDCVSRWLRNGKISDKAIIGLGRNLRIKIDVATKMVERRRQRFDDDAAFGALRTARTGVVDLQREILALKLGKLRKDVIDRAEVEDIYQAFSRAVQRLFKSGAGEWSEELYGAAQAGCGLGAFASMLRVKLFEMNCTLADMYQAELARYGDDLPEKGDIND